MLEPGQGDGAKGEGPKQGAGPQLNWATKTGQNDGYRGGGSVARCTLSGAFSSRIVSPSAAGLADP